MVFRNYFLFLSTVYHDFSLLLERFHCLGSGTPKYYVAFKSANINGGCCLFNKGIMTDALVVIHNQEKVKAVLRKSSKKQVQDWLPVEHSRVKALI